LSDERPSTLVVGAIRYRIAYVYDLHDSNGGRVEAALHANEALIEVEARLDPQERYVSLLHEALHIILRQAGYANDAVDDDILDALCYGIATIYRYNEYLKDFL